MSVFSMLSSVTSSTERFSIRFRSCRRLQKRGGLKNRLARIQATERFVPLTIGYANIYIYYIYIRLCFLTFLRQHALGSALRGFDALRTVRAAFDNGWGIIIDTPSPTDGDAVTASDIAKRTIMNKIDQGEHEHEVERTDTILAGIAVQYVRDRSTMGIIVFTDNKPVGRASRTQSRRTGTRAQSQLTD